MADWQPITLHAWGDISAYYLLPVAFVGAVISAGGREMLATLFAAKWLGHGRATECFLAIVALLYGLLLLTVPNAAYDSRVTVDIAYDFGHLLSVPLLLKAALTGGGLVLNILGVRCAGPMRFTGAALGCAIWIWLAAKFVAVGATATVGFPFCAISTAFSVRIMAMALAGLPAPAAPGRL